MPIVLFTTVLTISVLYAPQPLLPIVMEEFSVSRESAAFLTTVSFIPLSIAPLFYGYLLESMAPRKMLRWAVLLLALSEVLFFLARSFPVLIAIRLGQGLLIPAMLTALMTYVSQANRGPRLSRAMAAYVAATILGGFLGRAGSGLIASLFGWRTSFLILAATLLFCFALLGRLVADAPVRLARPTPKVLLEVLVRPFYRRVYLTVFCLFFVFAAVMNFIPFRLTEISDRASAFRIGMMYCGYLLGIVTSLNAVRIAARLGSEMRAIRGGLVLFALALGGLAAGVPEFLFLDMFLFCGAMFLVHATASGLLNRQALERKGVVNGLYVAFYYGGGALGSWLPGYVYRGFGWSGFLLVLLGVASVALVMAMRCGDGEDVGIDPQEDRSY